MLREIEIHTEVVEGLLGVVLEAVRGDRSDGGRAHERRGSSASRGCPAGLLDCGAGALFDRAERGVEVLPRPLGTITLSLAGGLGRGTAPWALGWGREGVVGVDDRQSQLATLLGFLCRNGRCRLVRSVVRLLGLLTVGIVLSGVALLARVVVDRRRGCRVVRPLLN